MKESDTFFVGVDKPVEVRLNILESSKQMIEILKHIEKIKGIRTEKQETMLVLKAKLDDLNKLVRKLNLTLPKTHLRAKEKVKQKRKKTVSSKARNKKNLKKKVKSKVESKAKPTISKLDKELMEVERQLSKLKR